MIMATGGEKETSDAYRKGYEAAIEALSTAMSELWDGHKRLEEFEFKTIFGERPKDSVSAGFSAALMDFGSYAKKTLIAIQGKNLEALMEGKSISELDSHSIVMLMSRLGHR